MARPLRIQYPETVYHVSCQWNERRNIFQKGDDRQAFQRYLSKSLTIYSVLLHGYVFMLMKNHLYLLVETPLGNLSELMRHFNITYTSYFNRRYKRVGHLYQGRNKGILVAMDLLFRHGGLSGPEIGLLFDVGYSAVNQERKKLRESGEQDEKSERLLRRLEERLLIMKI